MILRSPILEKPLELLNDKHVAFAVIRFEANDDNVEKNISGITIRLSHPSFCKMEVLIFYHNVHLFTNGF